MLAIALSPPVIGRAGGTGRRSGAADRGAQALVAEPRSQLDQNSRKLLQASRRRTGTPSCPGEEQEVQPAAAVGSFRLEGHPLTAHRKRGVEAMIDAGALPQSRGIAVLDGSAPCRNLENAEHAPSGAHHLSELIAGRSPDAAVGAGDGPGARSQGRRRAGQAGGRFLAIRSCLSTARVPAQQPVDALCRLAAGRRALPACSWSTRSAGSQPGSRDCRSPPA
jgi:hypothetical protein